MLKVFGVIISLVDFFWWEGEINKRGNCDGQTMEGGENEVRIEGVV